MVWVPQYKVYASDGLTLVYTFNFITSDNSPQSLKRSTSITGFRGQGDIVIPGSESSWDLRLGFCLIGDGYQDLISKMDSLDTTIAFNTKYVLKIDRTPSTTKDYNVMRLVDIDWEDTKRTRVQKGNLTFRVGAW
jgi:hypothetical protein